MLRRHSANPLFVARPRIAIQVIAPSTSHDQEILSFDVEPTLSLADLKGFVNAETGLAPESQQFWLNNHPIQGDEKTLQDLGIKDDDMLAMLMRQPEQSNNMGSTRRPQNAQRSQQQAQQGGQQNPQEIERMRQRILNDPAAMDQVRNQRPDLAESVQDPNRFKEVWLQAAKDEEEREQDRMERLQMLNEDPFNTDAQREIEEMIRRETVQENLQFAYEHNPEGKLDINRTMQHLH